MTLKNNVFLRSISWPIIFLIGQFFLLIIIGLFYSLFDDINNFNVFISNNNYILSICYLLIFLPLFLKRYQKYQKNYQEKLRDIFKIILLGIVISTSLNLIIYFIKLALNIKMTYSFNIFIIINTCIIGPILEELVFRGITYNILREKYNEKISIIVTTLIFSIMHFNALTIIYTLIVGYILNKLYIKYKNIKASIIFHITINFIASLAIPLIVI